MIRALVLIFSVVFFCMLLHPTGTSIIYVDNFPDNREDGSFKFPYSTITVGVKMANHGEDVIIRGGYYNGSAFRNRSIDIDKDNEIRVYPYGYFNDTEETVVFNASRDFSIFINRSHDVDIYGLVLNNNGGSNGLGGIYFNDSRNVTLVDLDVNGFDEFGIFINNSYNVTLVDLEVNGFEGDGIHIRRSKAITIVNCEVMDNGGNGIYWTGYGVPDDYNATGGGVNGTPIRRWFPSYDKVIGCNITGCDVSGNGGHGISLLMIVNNTISDNVISGNGGCGVRAEDSSGNLVFGNEIAENVDYGIYLSDGCTGNVIQNNTVLGNGGAAHQAFDANEGNAWDNGTEGNLWSDYEGVDLDGDGIGEIPYAIDGGGEASDRYPFCDRAGTLEIEILLDTERPVVGQEVVVFVRMTPDFEWPETTMTFWHEANGVTSVVLREDAALAEGDNWFSFAVTVGEGVQRVGVAMREPFDRNESLTIEPVVKSRESGRGLEGIGPLQTASVAVVVSALCSRKRGRRTG